MYFNNGILLLRKLYSNFSKLHKLSAYLFIKDSLRNLFNSNIIKICVNFYLINTYELFFLLIIYLSEFCYISRDNLMTRNG